MDQTRIFLVLGTTHCQVRDLSFLSTSRSSAEPRTSLLLAAVGCRCRLLLHAEGQRHQRIHFPFLRKKRRSIPASRVSVASEAAEVCASLKSVLELFLLEGKFIGVLVAGDLDQVPGLTTCERD